MRERELKLSWHYFGVDLPMSLPMRERELKLPAVPGDARGDGSLPMRERELKQAQNATPAQAARRSPCGSAN